MLGQRYYIYLFFLNALVSLTAFVPQILYNDRYNGSITSLVISIFVGMILLFLFQVQLNKFSRQSFPDILKRVPSSLLKKIFLFFQFILGIFSGVLFLNSLMLILEEFFKLNSNVIYYLFLVLIVFCILSETKSILFMLEIIVLFATPFFILILLRFFTDNLVLMDSIKESLTYIMHFPTWSSILSGLFVFTGFNNLVIYSEHIHPFSKKHFLIIWPMIICILISSYFIPIGYFGLKGVGMENLVWITTIDSMNINYFFLERIVLIFILVLVGLTLMYLIITYHSSIKMLQMMTKNIGGKLKWVGVLIIVLSAAVAQYYTDEINVLRFFTYFFVFRIILDLLLFFLLLLASRKRM